MITLPKQKACSLLETMPVKCRVIGNLSLLPNAVKCPEEDYFYKVITPAAFTSRNGQITFINAAEWEHAKQARKQMRNEGANKKHLSRHQSTPELGKTGNKRVNLFSPLAGGDPAGLISIAAMESIQYSDVILMPPTTTDSDVRALVEPLVSTPPLPALHRKAMNLIQHERDLREQKHQIDRQAAIMLITLAAQKLKKQPPEQPVLGTKQPLPKTMLAPILGTRVHRIPSTGMIGERVVEEGIVEERAVFKAVPAYSLEKMRDGEMRYVLADDWIGGTAGSIQGYAPVDRSEIEERKLANGTLDMTGEGYIGRDHLVLVPPGTSTSKVKRTLKSVEKSSTMLRFYLRHLERIDAESKMCRLEIARIVKRDRSLQMRLLRKALAKHPEFPNTKDHCADT